MNRADLKNLVYMQIAKTLSQLSTCNRLKVGAVLLGYELLRKSAEHFRLASYEVISYETERQCAPTATNAEPKR